MRRAEDFHIEIDPQGRILFEAKGASETSMRRIIEYLQETVGPVEEVGIEPGDPPTRHLHALTEEETRKQLRMENRGR